MGINRARRLDVVTARFRDELGYRSHFPHFMIAISRHGFGLCLEPEGGGREAHEGEDLLVEHAELGLEDLHEAVALA